MAKDPDRVAAGKKSKRKGSAFELKLAKEFAAWWGKGQFARSPGSGGWGRPQNRDGFNACGDIITTNRDFPWCLELKHQEGWNLDQLLLNDGCIIWKWWEQCVDETPENLLSMLIFKKNRQKPMVMIRKALVEHGPFGVSENVSDLYVELQQMDTTMFEIKDPQNGQKLVIFPLEDLFNICPTALGKETEDGGEE